MKRRTLTNYKEVPEKSQNCLPNSVEQKQKMVSEDVLFKVSMKFVVVYCCGLPLFGFITCVILAFIFHYEGSTRTHCNVPNYLPSISAAIGDYTPERYIWRICICLHILPRMATAVAYSNYYLSSPLRPMYSSIDQGWYRALCWLCGGLHLAENVALMTLTYVSSSENYAIHEASFYCFVFFSLTYMALTLYMVNHSGRRRTSTNGERSYQYKFLLYMIYISALLFAGYFFYRHNRYCEAGIYTFFAGCEYVVVLTNIAFHATVYFDMNDKVLQLATSTSNPIEYRILRDE